MRIFDEQRKSRLESTKIIFLFILSVVGTVFIIDFLILHILQQAGLGLNSKTIVVWCSIATVTIIAGGYAYHRYLLSSGGTAVALMLGGVEVDNRSKDIYERRFLNVVSEVSIAANIPTPSAFILESEDSINAFAAGFDPSRG